MKIFFDAVTLNEIKLENRFAAIEAFTLFPKFNVFYCLKMLNDFDFISSEFLAHWFNSQDPHGTVILANARGPNIDILGDTIDLLKYAVMLGNCQLVDFFLQRPQTSRQSFLSAQRLARHGTNALIIRRFERPASLF